MVKLDMYWMSNTEWMHWNNGGFTLAETAPEDAKKSYQRYLKQREDIDQRTKRTFVIPKTQKGIDFYEEMDPDWSLGSHETEDLLVFDIPFEEFSVLREYTCLLDDLEESCWRIDHTEIERYLSSWKEMNLQIPKVLGVLKKALQYGTFVEFVEAHIL